MPTNGYTTANAKLPLGTLGNRIKTPPTPVGFPMFKQRSKRSKHIPKETEEGGFLQFSEPLIAKEGQFCDFLGALFSMVFH